MLPPITQDAQRISLLFQYGVLPASAVIAWADAMILEMDAPPDSLAELSITPPDKAEDVMSCLHRLSVGADFWASFRSAIPQIRDFVVAQPNQAAGIAHHFFQTACSFSAPKVPVDLTFLYGFDDAFSLARDGIYGKPETIYQEFIRAMEKFTMPPQA